MQNREEIKPGMGGITPAQVAPAKSGARQPGALPRGPLNKPPPPLAAIFCVKLSKDLRSAVRLRALSEGLTDGAWVRGLMLDALAIESAPDRASARVTPEEIASATKLLANLRAVILDAREMRDGQAKGAVAAMELQHKRLVDLITRMGAPL